MSKRPFQRDLAKSIALLGPLYGAPLALNLLVEHRLGLWQSLLLTIALLLGTLLGRLPRPLRLALIALHCTLLVLALALGATVYVLIGPGQRLALALGALLCVGLWLGLQRRERARGKSSPRALLLLGCLIPLCFALYSLDVPWFVSLALLGLLLPLWTLRLRNARVLHSMGVAWLITLGVLLAAFAQGVDTANTQRVLDQPGVSALYTYKHGGELAGRMGRGARFIERLPDGDYLAFTLDPGPYLYRLDPRPPYAKQARSALHLSDQLRIVDGRTAFAGWGSSPAQLDLQSLEARRLCDSRSGHVSDLIGPVAGHLLFGYDWLRPYFGDLELGRDKPSYPAIPGRWYNFEHYGELAWISVLSLNPAKHGLYQYDPRGGSLELKAQGIQGSMRLDERYAYVIDPLSPDLTRIDRNTGERRSIDLGLGTRCMWLDPGRGLLAVSGFLDGRLWLIDTAQMRVLKVLQTGGRVRWIAYDELDDALLVCSNVGGIKIELGAALASRAADHGPSHTVWTP
ncbi:MAG: hypothetical protein P9M14_00310 [Candidatus Alcyoniella australis]|nr:hypothetical protein [Candidatus Alcyoniella australis]